jgi:hypothetical protein
MPHYFFHIDDGLSTPDPVGLELPDLEAAQAEAVIAAGSILKDSQGDFWASGETWIMSVTDDEGLLLFELRFSSRFPSDSVSYSPADD